MYVIALKYRPIIEDGRRSRSLLEMLIAGTTN
jgi:hypothetical protein